MTPPAAPGAPAAASPAPGANGNATIMALLKNPAVIVLLAAMFGGGAAGRHILGDAASSPPAGHAALLDLVHRVTAVEATLQELRKDAQDAMPRAQVEQALTGLKDGISDLKTDLKEDIKDLSRKIDALVP